MHKVFHEKGDMDMAPSTFVANEICNVSNQLLNRKLDGADDSSNCDSHGSEAGKATRGAGKDLSNVMNRTDMQI